MRYALGQGLAPSPTRHLHAALGLERGHWVWRAGIDKMRVGMAVQATGMGKEWYIYASTTSPEAYPLVPAEISFIPQQYS
jgi:hypothetical protein